MKTINIIDVIGKEVRSRNAINLIKEQYLCNEDSFIIDMKGVTFISRSFADELYNFSIEEEVHFVNKNETVEKMLNAVWQGRKNKRVRNKENVAIEDYTNVEDFFKFLQTI